MSKNEIASTLFKFVNLRNPEPPKPEDLNIKFSNIADSVLQSSYFYDAIMHKNPNYPKSEALLTASQTFTGVLDKTSIRYLSSSLFDFSTWLVKNKKNYTEQELQAKAKLVTPLTADQLKKVWDNLFYQTITSNSFEAKEALMTILLGQHVATGKKDNDPDHNSKLVNAKIALPASIFTDLGLAQPFESNNYMRKAPDKNISKKMAAASAKFIVATIETLKEEINILEEDYKKNNAVYHLRAKESHESAIAPIMDKYYADLKKAQQDSCALRLADTKYDPNDPCQQPAEVPYPKLPKFEFVPMPEIEPSMLRYNLSRKSYGVLLEALGSKDPLNDDLILQSSGTSRAIGTSEPVVKIPVTFADLRKSLDKSTASSIGKLKSTLAFAKSKVSIGGTLVDTAKASTNVDEGKFILSAVRTGFTYKYSIWAGIDPNDNILSIDVTKTYQDGTTSYLTYPAPAIVRNGLTAELHDFFEYTLTEEEYFNLPTLDITLNILDKSKKITEIYPIMEKEVISGKLLSVFPEKAPLPLAQRSFGGFGFRQLGVADYLKVEQSVQCYVEGEVSHIENVMAREYKEKSTRRLRRTEDTTTSSEDTEREKLTDTSSADRFEMHTEVAKVIQESKDLSANINSGYKGAAFYVDAGLAYANSSATEQSNDIAVTQAKEVTERALDRVVAKVREERIRKVVEEFEENNKHGFDNREGNDHVVGVYRWVDKLYKNQIFNFGRRLMFEFMVPDPARLHLLGMSIEGESDTKGLLSEPDNPATFNDDELKIATAGYLTEYRANYWAALYNVEIEPYPQLTLTVGKSLAYGKDMGSPKDQSSAVGLKDEIEIPEGYESVTFGVIANGKTDGGASLRVGVGNKLYNEGTSLDKPYVVMPGFVKSMPISISSDRYWSFNLNVSVSCRPTQDNINGWKQRTYKAIMDAYHDAVDAYREQEATEKSKEETTKGTNPGFYRDIENLVLRKNCISYLLDKTNGVNNTYGKSMGNLVDSFTGYEVKRDSNLTAYGNFVKFIEQAFEWDIMSYSLYPYYWAGKETWKDKYQFDETSDPVFRNFMQAGMARVIVTVRPGFEEAVYHYIKTGAIWNGGQVPVIGDETYMGIVDEVRTIPAEPVGKAWVTRVPTDLTILQAGSIGLKVEKALPCDCAGIEDFENPEAIPCDSNFEITNTILGPSAPVNQ